MRRAGSALLLLVALVVVGVVAYQLVQPASKPSPSPSPTLAPTASPAPTPTPSPSPSPSPSPTLAPTASPAPTPTPVPTPLLFTSNDGYQMTLPAGWTATSVGPGEIGVLLDLLGSANPDLESLVKSILDLTGARVSMIGGDLSAQAAVPPNVTVLVQPSGGLPLNLVAPVAEQVIKRVPGVGSVTRTSVTLPAGDAVRFDYTVTPASGGTPIQLQTYLLVQGSNSYLVTFAAGSDVFGSLQGTFDAVIQSLRFGV